MKKKAGEKMWMKVRAGRWLHPVVLSAALLASFCSEVHGQVDQRHAAALLFNTASRLYRQKNWSEAAAVFGDFLSRFPGQKDALEARFARGYCFNRLGQHAAAVEDLRVVTRQKGSEWAADAHFYLGRSLEALAEAAGTPSTESQRAWREAAANYGVAFKVHTAALAETPRDASREIPQERLELCVLSLTAQGEALYKAGAFRESARALAPLLEEKRRYERAANYPRGLYFLALAHHAHSEELKKNGSEADDSLTLECLVRLSSPDFDHHPLWEEAVYFLGRLLHLKEERQKAIACYERLLEKPGKHAAEAAYYRALAFYEEGTSESLKRAGQELARFQRRFPSHPLAFEARFYEAVALFDRELYDDAAKKLRALTTTWKDGEGDPQLLAQAFLCLGQSLLLKTPPDGVAAVEALSRSVEICQQQTAADSEGSGAKTRLVEALYWQGEALLGQGEGHLETAAARFHQVADDYGQVLPALAEEALHKEAVAFLRGEKHRQCAAAAKRYRSRYPKGRFVVDSLKISAKNALQAEPESLDDDERQKASRYYFMAARLVRDRPEAVRLEYLSGVARYYGDDYAGAIDTLLKVYRQLPSDLRMTKEYIELPFFLADSMAQLPRSSPPSSEALERFSRATKLFDEYLTAVDQIDSPEAKRHVATALVNQGLVFQWSENHPRARESFRTFLKYFPEHSLAPRVHFSLAQVHQELGELEAAVAEYRKSAGETEDGELAVEALLQAGAVERRRGRHDASRRLVEEALERVEKHAVTSPTGDDLLMRARFDRARILIEGGQTDSAQEALTAFLNDFPGSRHEAEARIQLGYLYLDGKKPHEALRVIKTLTSGESKPQRDQALYLQAWCLRAVGEAAAAKKERTGSFKEMETAYRRLISDHPHSELATDAMLELAQHLFNTKAFEEAKLWFSRVRQTVEGPPRSAPDAGSREARWLEQSLYGLAIIAFEAKDFEVARQLFDRVVDIGKQESTAPALFQAARAWMLSGEEGEAVKRFREIVFGRHENGWAKEFREETFLRLGECYHHLQEYEEAVTVLTQMLREFPEGSLRHEGRFVIGFAFQYMDRFEKAVEAFRQVVAETGAVVAARALYHIGECFMDQGKYREAAREFLTVVANFDLDGDYQKWVRRALLAAGNAYEAAEELTAASQQWTELVKRFPASDEAKAARKRLKGSRNEL